MTEADIKNLLRKRYTAPQFAFMTNVANSTGFASTYADGVAFSLWPSSGFQVEGFEIKVSRQDFLNEMKHPEKASNIITYCDKWWLVAPKGLVHKDELPKAWGFYEIVNDKFFTRKPAPQLENKEFNINFFAAMIRRATEDVTPNEFLQAERKEMEKSAKLEAAAGIKSAEEKAERLLKDIADFEAAAGINIRGGYSGTARNGRVLKFLLDGFNSYDWKASAIANALEGIKEALPYFEELTKISEGHKTKVESIIREKI